MAKTAGGNPASNAEVDLPQVIEGFGPRRDPKLLFKLRPLFLLPASVAKALQYFPKRIAVLVMGGKRKFPLRVLDQVPAERGVKEFSAARNSIAWTRSCARFRSIRSLKAFSGENA